MNKSSAKSIAAIVLAGGQSSRMGRDKALISIGNLTLLEQIYALARECASRVYVITPWPERYQDLLLGECSLIREVPLPGETKPHGPLVGFAQALAQVQTEWVLLLACDLPQLHPSEVNKWSGYLGKASEEVIALLPRHPKGWEPLCGFYRRRCLTLLNEFINQGGRSFQCWLGQHQVGELPVTDSQLLFNCNTPEDIEKVKSHLR